MNEILNELYQVITDRLSNPKEGSYTCYLFDKGLDKILKKIGEEASEFKVRMTMGTINFPEDYKGKWVILFSHPADFTPVCTTEFMTFASMQEDFR